MSQSVLFPEKLETEPKESSRPDSKGLYAYADLRAEMGWGSESGRFTLLAHWPEVSQPLMTQFLHRRQRQ